MIERYHPSINNQSATDEICLERKERVAGLGPGGGGGGGNPKQMANADISYLVGLHVSGLSTRPPTPGRP